MNDASSSPSRPPAPRPVPRLASLDALRGFDMLWIVGGREALVALLSLAGLDGLQRVVAHHTEHTPWHGFRAWDLVFPLFLFLAGVSTAFSFAHRRARGVRPTGLAVYALQRGLGLVLLGAIYNGLFAFELADQRWASVLGRIGVAWLCAAWLTLALAPRNRALVTVGILGVYWAALALIPVPGHGAGDLAQGANLADWLDQRLLPGRLHGRNHDPEGLASTLPAIATALLGTLAGDWLRRGDLSGAQRVRGLGLAGALLLALGHAWGLVFPLNKHLWTSSFVLVCGGWSALLLALFHAVFDLCGARRLAFALSVIGAQALVAYMAARFIDFGAVAALLAGRAVERGLLDEAFVPVLALALLWSALAALGAARRRRRA